MTDILYVQIIYKMVFSDVFYLEAKQRLKGKKSGFFRVNREIKQSQIKAGIQYSNRYIQLKIYCLQYGEIRTNSQIFFFQSTLIWSILMHLNIVCMVRSKLLTLLNMTQKIIRIYTSIVQLDEISNNESVRFLPTSNLLSYYWSEKKLM